MKQSRWLSAVITVAAGSVIIPTTSHCEVVKLVIDEQKPADDPAISASTGGYEWIRGRLIGEVDPGAVANRIIQDIDHAPRNAHGKVEYVATFTLLRPTDHAKDSGVLIASIPNRGNHLTPSWRARGLTDPAFYERGYSMLWVGWQGDLGEKPSRTASAAGIRLESIQVPVARGPGGKPLTGPYLMRIPVSGGSGPSGTIMRLGQGGAGALSYPPATFDTRKAKLTGGSAEDNLGKATGARYTISPADWQWWDCKADSQPGPATAPGDFCVKRLKGVFNPAESYTLVFPAKDPLILGLGLAATRDGASFFRYAKSDAEGTPNPIAGQVKAVVGQGESQVGNFVRTFIALGFNADEQGRRVWDGAHSHIGGRRTPINYRFATTGSSTTLYMPGSEGVLWWSRNVNEARGGPARSNLDRCTANDTCPKIIETFGGAELWNQRFTPDLVGFGLKKDLSLPANVRRYYFPGTSHGGGFGGFRAVAVNDPRLPADCTLPLNPNPQTDQVRAVTVALVDWVVNGKEPPASAYPALREGTLVKDQADALAYPSIPGMPRPYGLANPVLVYDYGSRFSYDDMSGIIDRQPPAISKVVPALVAKVDGDGNETSGVPSVQLMAPLGTYLSWNTYKAGPYAGQICSFNAGWIPFAKTAADRASMNDPRLSLEERYGSRNGYVEAVRRAVEKAQTDGFLLPRDAARLIREATEAADKGDLAFLKP